MFQGAKVRFVIYFLVRGLYFFYLALKLTDMKKSCMLASFLVASVIFFTGWASGQTPQIKWHFDVSAPAFGQAAMGDIDNDGKQEIVFSTYMNDGKCYALNAEDGSLLWEFSTGSCNDAAPLIYDVDQDGNLEVILASSCITETYCLDGVTGGVKWQAPTGGTDSPPVVGDVDNDGKPEVLHGEFNGSVICINGEDGSIRWEKLIDPNSSIQTSPSLLDVDGNGQLDFVVASWGFSNNFWIKAYRGDNQQLLWQNNDPTDDIYHGGSFADIDGDGKPELAFGCYDDHVYVVNAEDGSSKWSFDMGAYCYVGGPVVMADINNDDQYELLAAGWYKMKAISDSGSQIWNYNIPDYASCFRGPALSDINSDGKLELVFGTSEGKVIALRGTTGAQLWTLDLAADYGDTLDIDHAPVIGDFDGDGQLDGFVVGGFTAYPNIANDYGRAYAFTLGTGHGPEWKMFQHDSVRSGRVPLDWMVGIAEPAKRNNLILNPGPNPFRDELRLRVELKNPGPLRIELLDLPGRLISVLEDVPGHYGDKVYSWSLPDLPQGVYLLSVMAGVDRKTVKIIKSAD
jgi:outer membrane protein assembly factor BamB